MEKIYYTSYRNKQSEAPPVVERYYNWHNRCNILKRLFEPHDLELKLYLKRFGYMPYLRRRSLYDDFVHVAKYIIAQDLDKLYGVPECLTVQLTYRIIDNITITRGGKHE